jgi:hypothetical protein
MILRDLISQVIRLVSGGTFTDDTRYDPLDIEAKIHYARANVIQQFFTKNKRISGEWLQTYNAVYDANLQGNIDFVKFAVPSGIPLDIYRDGFIYVGDKNGNIAYRRVNNRAELANYNLHRITRISSDRPKFIYSEGYIEVYGNSMIKELRIDGVFANPTELPTYNQDIDNYPLSEDLISQVKDFLLKTALSVEQQKQPDLIPDSKE